jgi:small subunit ribosomal protein S17
MNPDGDTEAREMEAGSPQGLNLTLASKKTEGRRRRKALTGLVISDKMQKTRTVSVTRLRKHAKYGKFIRRSSKYKVHDEKEVSHLGDIVRIAETRPLSKTKRWRLVEVLEKSRLAGADLDALRDDAGIALPAGEGRTVPAGAGEGRAVPAGAGEGRAAPAEGGSEP